MSDTPETDKEWRHPASFDGSERVVHISVAQKLERERDEAREELAEAKREAENLARSIYRTEYSDNDTGWELLESVAGVISQIDNMYAGVREQRDEAREDAEHWKTEYEIVVARLCGKKHPRDNGIISDHEIIPKLEREREELQVAYDTLATEHMLQVNKLCNERDEAREALVRSNHFLQQAEENLDLVYKERDEALARVEIITPSKNNPVAEFFSSSNTPETDEQINGKPCTRFAIAAGDSLRDALVPSEFARKLERERNEWAALAGQYKAERDEAREALENYKASTVHSCNEECKRPMCVLRRERDEANYFLRELAEVDGQLKVRICELCEVLRKTEKERDEAILVMRETRRRLDDAWLEIERLKNL